ncbi:protein TRIGALACTOSYLDIACYLGLYCEROL 4, chloroplastic [Dorcoceras hygrometricum]|uniref:Protein TRIGALACTOSYLDIACYLGLYCEROL 4, chloroplastic n=1 Tax=Dorcoceras hygrometricum TaxID=472368 RepID=A0A2Z7CHN3_9LAMI|nr:protein TRIGALACTOSYLDIACYLGLYCEROL 4, chloroplastic [Dorcoceras hygrometricum]
MKKLRWTVDGGLWDVDVSTPVTVEGVARPVSGEPLPLGLSRGARLSRHRQVDFFQRFMAVPLVPNHDSARGLSLQRVLSLPQSGESWLLAILGQFNIQKFVTSLRRNGFRQESDASSLQSIWRHLSNKTLYALNFCSEWSLTPHDTMLLSLETCADNKAPRKKAVLHHKFLHHNLILEAASPSLLVNQHGNYWDVPLTMAMDLSSVASDSGTSYHLCVNHTTGSPKQYDDQPTQTTPAALLSSLCAKCGVSFKKNFNIWRSEAQKMKMVQPYDILLSTPHISASGILGAVVTASVGDYSLRSQVENGSSGFQAKGETSAILADLFASVTLSAQHGNFQKPFLDLTRFYTRLDIPSGSNFLKGATRMAFDLYNSEMPNVEAVRTLCPSASFSFQQQIGGPFSFRVDAGVALDPKKNDWILNVNDPVIAIEYALQVLGSAKAVAWYSLKQREFMVELRFFES